MLSKRDCVGNVPTAVSPIVDPVTIKFRSPGTNSANGWNDVIASFASFAPILTFAISPVCVCTNGILKFIIEDVFNVSAND